MTVGDQARIEVHRFYEEQQKWIEAELRRGITDRRVRVGVDVADLGATILAALEGSMLMSRAGGAPDLATRVGTLLTHLIAA